MVDQETWGLLMNFVRGLAILLVVCVIFDILRYFYPKIYFYREVASKLEECNDYDGTPLHAPPRPASYPFAWVKPVLMYEEESLIKTHGLDAALYVRMLRSLAAMFALLSVYSLIVLMPLYGTASNKRLPETAHDHVVGVEIFSLSNVPANDQRLWGTLVSELVVLGIIALFVRRELGAHKVYRLAYRADSVRNPSNYAVLALDIPVEWCSAMRIRAFFNRCFPGEVAAVYHIRDAENLHQAKDRIVTEIAKHEKAKFKLIQASHRRPNKDHSDLDEFCKTTMHACDEAKQNLDDMRADLDTWAPLTHAAIVVFYRKRAATVAACTPLWSDASEWKIERAAEPRAVNWNRIEITKWTSSMRTVTSMFVIAAFVFFWFAPVTGIQALKNLDNMASIPAFAFLKPLVTSTNPETRRFVGLIQGLLPPLLLFVILQLVPMFFRFIIGFERIADKGHFESKIRTYLFFFYVVSNFFYVVLTGSVLDEFRQLVDDPRIIVQLLSTTVPDQATFLMKYVLINAFLGSALGLLNIGRLLVRPLMMMQIRTIRAKRAADAVFSAYPLFKMYALGQMIALISIIYSTIAPLICMVATIYFTIAYVCSKFVIMYSHRPRYEAGGHMFPGSWYAILVAAYLHQVVLVCIFLLKSATSQAIITLFAILLTLGYTISCYKHYFRIARNGSMIDQMDADERSGHVDVVPSHFVELYLHPGIRPLEEMEDLTGLPRELRYPSKYESKPSKGWLDMGAHILRDTIEGAMASFDQSAKAQNSEKSLTHNDETTPLLSPSD